MKYLGVDYGLKRVGLAISQGDLASPYKIIEINSLSEAIEKILTICKLEDFDKVIVGMPEGDMGKYTLKFIDELKKRGVDAEATDETLSSKQALDDMIEAGIGKKKRRLNDDMAAAIILQNYLEIKG